MRITVTQEHINRGERTDASWCPISLAVRELEPDYPYVITGTRLIQLFSTTDDGPHKTLELPIEATRFISRFDTKKKVKPFTFETDKLPTWIQRFKAWWYQIKPGL